MENIIIVSAIIHAYVFAFLFFSKKQISSRILGLYMVSFFIQSFLFANFHIFKFHALTPFFYLLISSISLIDFPIIFLYVKMMSEVNYKWSRTYLLHFLPATIILLLQFGSYFLLESDMKELLFFPKDITFLEPKLSLFFFIYNVSLTILLLQVLIYSPLMIRKLIIHKKNIEKYYSYKEHISLNWLLGFIILYLSYYLFELTIFIWVFPLSETVYFSIVSLHIFIIGIWGLKQKTIFGKNKIESTIISKNYISSHKVQVSEIKKENKSFQRNNDSEIVIDKFVEDNIDLVKRQELLSKEMSDELAVRLKKLMIEDKLFLNPELSLEELASIMNVHKNYVSFVINEKFNKNFYNLINTYRIEEACKMLSNSEFNYLSIEGIAKSCGYKSRNVFYPLFKKATGYTPLEYKNLNQK